MPGKPAAAHSMEPYRDCRRTLDGMVGYGPGSVPLPDDAAAVIARLWERVALERGRAARAEEIAAHYEAKSAAGPEHLRVLQARMAVLHRQMQTRHRTSAALHEVHAIRMEAWADGRGPGFRPVFMSAVATAIGVGSAAATLRGRRPAAVVTAASDAVARAAHDLEVALGEGPGVTAMTAGAPVSAVGGLLLDRWPLYGPAIGELGVRAVVAVPLRHARGCLGTLCAYSPEPVLPDSVAAAAGRVADAVTHTMLLSPPDPAAGGAVRDEPLFAESDYQAIVHQAAGMVAVQFGCGIDDAERLLRARAFADGQPVEEVALSVLRRETRLD
jgi:hypothetical protein